MEFHRFITFSLSSQVRITPISALKHMYQLGGMECSCTRTPLGSKGPLIHGFVHSSARRLCHAYETQQSETAVYGCHCPDDMVVHMRRVLFIPRSRYEFFSGMLLRSENRCWVTFHKGLYGGSSDCNLGVTNSKKDTQGHPTTVFCKIYVRRNKFFPEFSIVEDGYKFLDDRSIHVQFSKLM